jgi:hypothetical protein
MARNLTRLFSLPTSLLGLTALLTAVLLQSGEMGSVDTSMRLQNTHSFWTSEPPVRPEDYPDFGLIGRNGTIHGRWGIGQSILMLPFDMLGTYLAGLPISESFEGHDPSVREMVVSYSGNTLVCVLAVLVCFRFLRRLEFTVNQALAGALGLLFGTTFLHYTQNMMENNLIMLLDLTGFCFQFEWLRSGRARALLLGSATLGANLLVRLTTAMDIIACGLFLLLIVGMEGVRESSLRQRLASFTRVVLPVYVFFFAMDPLYQWYRYGSIFNTYAGIFAQQMREREPDLPAKFPWTTPWHEGILGPLITPEKSIFLFDPLIVATLVLALLLWKHMRGQTKAWVLATGGLVCAYIVFYARFFDWSGDFAWGDRYVSMPVELLAMMAIPLLLRHRAQLRTVLRRIGWGIVAASIVVQLASVVFWHPLEVYQVMTLGPSFVVGLRFKNIVADILGKYEQWGLTNDWMWKDPWQRFHSTTPYFMPFMLWRDGSIRPGSAHALIAAWFLLVAALIGVLVLIRAKARKDAFQEPLDTGAPAGAAPC